MRPRRCALAGVSFSTFSLGWYSQFQHIVNSAEHAEHSETAGHTYEGTPIQSPPYEMRMCIDRLYWVALLVYCYLCNTASFGLCAVCRFKDHHMLLHYSPRLKNTCVRQVVLDKCFPLTIGRLTSRPRAHAVDLWVFCSIIVWLFTRSSFVVSCHSLRCKCSIHFVRAYVHSCVQPFTTGPQMGPAKRVRTYETPWISWTRQLQSAFYNYDAF